MEIVDIVTIKFSLKEDIYQLYEIQINGNVIVGNYVLLLYISTDFDQLECINLMILNTFRKLGYTHF